MQRGMVPQWMIDNNVSCRAKHSSFYVPGSSSTTAAITAARMESYQQAVSITSLSELPEARQDSHSSAVKYLLFAKK